MNLFFNLRKEIMSTLHDITYMLLSVKAQYIESSVQDFETKYKVNLTSFSY